MINFVGFISLPPVPGVKGYEAVEQPDGRVAVRHYDGLRWLSVPPSGVYYWDPPEIPLGGYQLGNPVSGGLMFRPIAGASFLLPAENIA